jgi:hypothetical protein
MEIGVYTLETRGFSKLAAYVEVAHLWGRLVIALRGKAPQ